MIWTLSSTCTPTVGGTRRTEAHARIVYKAQRFTLAKKQL